MAKTYQIPSKWQRLRSGSSLLPRLKNEEILDVIAKQDSSFKDVEEQTKAKPNPNICKPHAPYPQALYCPRAKTNEPDDHLLEAF